MNRDEIKKFLPHREPMLLVDNIDFDGEICKANYHVTGEEFFVQGHFPGNPVVPGVIQCEIMAQSCALFLGDDLIGKTPLYAGIDKVRFKRVVKPGDTIEIEAKILSQRGNLYQFDAKATVEGELCVKGILSFMLIDKQ